MRCVVIDVGMHPGQIALTRTLVRMIWFSRAIDLARFTTLLCHSQYEKIDWVERG